MGETGTHRPAAGEGLREHGGGAGIGGEDSTRRRAGLGRPAGRGWQKGHGALPGAHCPRGSPRAVPQEDVRRQIHWAGAPLQVTQSTAQRSPWRVPCVSHFSKNFPVWDFTFFSKKEAFRVASALGVPPGLGTDRGAGRRPLKSQMKEAREPNSRDTRLFPSYAPAPLLMRCLRDRSSPLFLFT